MLLNYVQLQYEISQSVGYLFNLASEAAKLIVIGVSQLAYCCYIADRHFRIASL